MISVRGLGRTLVAMAMLAPCFARADDLAQLRALTAAYNASGHDLFVKFAAKPGNIVFSPYSVGSAMAMALAGARGETEREMATVLRHTLPRDAIDAANARVLQIFKGYDTSGEPACLPGGKLTAELGSMITCDGPPPANVECSSGVKGPRRSEVGRRCLIQLLQPSAQLSTANALMLLKGRDGIISADYMRLLGDKYQAEVFHDGDLDAVNRWVAQRTEGRINRILDRLEPTDVAVILNAVYFKAAWRKPFSQTREEDFRLTATTSVKVDMMSAREGFAVVQRPGFRAIRLPYGGASLSMVVVRPDDVDGATRLAGELDAGALAALFGDLNKIGRDVEGGRNRGALMWWAPEEFDVKLPRFKTSFSTHLKPLFEQAGMTSAFDLARADFSGMTGERRQGLAIDAIEHRAVIDVNERGSEAAAATLIGTISFEHSVRVEPFVVDRPFLFYIVDETTGAILFEGRISDPRES